MIPKRFLLVCSTFLLSVLLYVDRVCISTAEGPIRDDLGLSKEQFGWALSAFALGYALCQTPAGWLADRLGPRKVLTAVVVFWSIFTGLTAAAYHYVVLLATRLLFGAGEAGAFPGIARASYSWIPMQERGLVQGINFSGSRLGAAAALPAIAWMIKNYGWRPTFIGLMLIGFAWAVAWYLWFRDDPTEDPGMGEEERKYILANRQQQKASDKGQEPSIGAATLLNSRNVWFICAQYFCSNFTFFFCLTWLFPHLKGKYQLETVQAAIYAAAPLVLGACGSWFAGWLIDYIYRQQRWTLSRRVPAIIGYCLAAAGLVASIYMDTAIGSIVCFSIAIFGADMKLPPSWSVCIDIGRNSAGVVSGTMNMAGNIGAFLTALAFPYLQGWTDSNTPFFILAAALNVIAVGLWLLVRPERTLEEY
jgi:ACS family glucarate transporter-like MFS transporter